MEKQKNIAIIFAGGTGQRFGAEIPKQFVEVYGKPIIIHTLEKFQMHPEIDEIYVGCIESWIPFLEFLVKKYGITKIPSNGILKGGNSGQDTIYQILKRAQANNSDNSIVLIHDGVRPIVTDKEISSNIECVKQNGNAITCIPFTETPIYSEDGKEVDRTLERKKVFRGVAPQSFYLDYIISAHEKIRENDPDYTGVYNGATIVDSASLVTAAYGTKAHIVIGNPNNMKVTNTSDFLSLLGRLQESDLANYFYSLQNRPFTPNDGMIEAQKQKEQEEAKQKKLGTYWGNK